MKPNSTSKIDFLPFLLLLFLFSIHTNAQTFEWAKVMGGGSGSEGKDVTVDAQGNVYTVGQFTYSPFTGPVDFDPGAAGYYFYESGTFISKLDSNGNFVWARNLPGVGISGSSIKAISLDKNGNIIIAGNFHGKADFDPGPDTFYLTTNTYNSSDPDVFVAKYNAGGNFLWAKSISGHRSKYLSDLAIDSQNNILMGGNFIGDIDMDPGPDTFALVPTASTNAFILKLSSNGNFLWAKQLYDMTEATAAAIKADSSGQVYIAGTFSATDFDPGPDTTFITSQGQLDGYILKLTANGDFVWVRTFGGIDYDAANAIVIDKAGFISATGYFKQTASFNHGTQTFSFTAAGYSDAFICRLNADGDYLWVKQIGNADVTLGDAGYAIAADGLGSIYCMGLYKDSIDFDPGPGVSFENSEGDYSTYILKLDSTGNFSSVGVAKGQVYVFGQSLALDKNNNILFTGKFAAGVVLGPVDLDPGPGIYPLFSPGGGASGNQSTFVAKWSQPVAVLPLKLLSLEGEHKNTYNLIKWQTAYEVNVSKFIVQRSVDGIRYYNIGSVAAKLKNSNTYEFVDANLADNSIFYYRLKMLDKDGSFTYSKVVIIKIALSQLPFTIAPNPANNFVTISFTNTPASTEVSVYGALGNRLLNQFYKIPLKSIRLSTQDLQSGVYFVEVKTSANTFQRQLIISR